MKKKENDSNYRKLIIGKNRKGEISAIESEGLLCHTALIGHSGFGKSFTLGRLIEEVIIQTEGLIIAFDFNSDFVQMERVNKEIWSKENEKEYFLVPGYELDESFNKFTKCWTKETDNRILVFSAYPAERDNLKISWEKLSDEELRQLIGLDPKDNPDAVWLINELIQEAKNSSWSIKHWEAISPLIVAWARKHFPNSTRRNKNITFTERLARHVSITVPLGTAQRTATAIIDAINYGIWNRSGSLSELDMNFPTVDSLPDVSSYRLPRLTCINLDSLPQMPARLIVVRHIIDRLWGLVTNSRWQIIHQGKDDNEVKDKRIPIFLVVDECHRLAPQKAEGLAQTEVLDLFRQIAAEGRKYGLFLILSTQRPSKLHQDILSECDNICTMRLVSDIDKDWILQNFGIIKENQLLGINKFEPGEAIFSGKWMNYKTERVKKVAAQRT